jgi:CheY-like chemotaxis protein/two-component sensor histidine kinase
MAAWIVALFCAVAAAGFAALWYRNRRPAPPPPAAREPQAAAYVGGMAHDFNNLFGIVIGNLDIAVAQNRDEALREPLKAALDTALRAAQISRRLHTLMRPQPMAPRTFELDAMLPKLLDEIRAGSESPAIHTDFAAGASVSVDPDMLVTALHELLRNAAEAMPEGGTVTIATRAEAGGVRLAITDTGPGMTAEVQAQAFDPFFSTRKGVRGAGLGLCLVRSFAERSGGQAMLESTPSSGTTVTIHLPTAVAAPVAAPGPVASTVAPAGATVLVVEDNAPMRALARTYLTEFGYRTEIAESAEAAIALLRDGRPIDLLFTDLVLPGALDGRELARIAMRLRPTLKCLVTTGGDDAAIDGLPVLAKPYRKDALARAVRQCLEQA